MPRKQINSDETKADKFIRLAEKRMSKAMKDISILGNLATSAYEYDAEQIDIMKSSIEKTVNETFAKFGGKKKLEGFKF